HPAVAQVENPTTGPSLEARVDFLRQNVEHTLQAFDEIAAKKDVRFEARQLTTYAHYTLALGKPADKAEAALRRALACQDMNPRSPHFGEFAAVEGQQPGPAPGADPNATNAVTEVTILPLVQVLHRYGDKLSPELRDKIKESLAAALPVIRRHQ